MPSPRPCLLLLLLVACGKDDSADPTSPDDTGPPACEESWSYPDGDGDGWGTDEGAVLGCEAPSGWVDRGGDCDDTDPTVHPDAEERCNGRDDDCGDGYDDIVIAAWGTQLDGTCHGAAYVAFGPIEGTWSLGDADIAIYGEAETAFASGLDAGDIDQDGRADLLVGAYWADGVDQNSGNAYLYYAPTAGTWSLTDANAVLQGANEGDAAGQSVALGDIDGDSRGDLIVGACYEDTGATQAGSVYVFFPEIW